MVNIIGDDRNNRLRGTKRRDRIDGRGGSDRLFGLAGKDILLGGDGDTGNDLLLGGSGNDSLYGGGGRDTLKGGSGNDLLTAFGRKITVPIKTKTILEGGSGNDSIYGSDGRDILRGETGNDTLDGFGGRDLLEGGSGNDELLTNASDGKVDVLRGGTGDDTYTVRVAGFSSRFGPEQIIEGVNQGIDTITTETSSWTLPENVENLLLSGLEDGTATGNQLDNIIRRDSLLASSNVKTLQGLDGNDTLNGTIGNDVLVGGEGADRFLFDFGFYTPGSIPPGYERGTDTITDFVRGTDKIALARGTFTALTTNIGQDLGAEFASVADDVSAETSSAIIVFSQASQKVFYNVNGSSLGFGDALASGAFAIVTGATLLSSTDFEIVRSGIANLT